MPFVTDVLVSYRKPPHASGLHLVFNHPHCPHLSCSGCSTAVKVLDMELCLCSFPIKKMMGVINDIDTVNTRTRRQAMFTPDNGSTVNKASGVSLK